MASTSFRSPNYKWEFMFCKISNGPYSLDWNHYWEDELRLGKFSKDTWNNVYLFTQRFDASYQLLKDMMDELKYSIPTTPPCLVGCDNLFPTFITPDGPTF
ncbi:4531_t:CDS:2 [Entrophospora sp. SA101]|nr:4531_t:CDS:2 [Entrophospora sp. SA101]